MNQKFYLIDIQIKYIYIYIYIYINIIKIKSIYRIKIHKYINFKIFVAKVLRP